jgi:hypothetical protein
MNNNKKPSVSLALTLIGTFFIVLVLCIYLQVLWIDWVIQRIFNKDFSGLNIFLIMFIIEICMPKALHGITTLALILMTLYIFLLA